MPSANPPRIKEHHVRLPEQAARILKADVVHLRGITGRGIRIAMIDSGFFPHPYYLRRGYKIRYITTRKEPKPYVDQVGHGTAQLASLFSIAPDAEVLAIKCLDRDPSEALEKAFSLKPDILSLAWGFNIDEPGATELPAEYRRMHELILRGIQKGVCVVAAAGNGQYSYPGSMPEVISAGGVYYSPEGTFGRSDVSSEFQSSIFGGRQVPDICGLVGNRPHGRLLLVPVPPKAKMARRPSFNAIPALEAPAPGEAGQTARELDGTVEDPIGAPTEQGGMGWAMFSGTSAATAMISGAAALLLQARPGLRPADIKDLLSRSARPVEDAASGVLSCADALNLAWQSPGEFAASDRDAPVRARPRA